jgi:rhomboid protease GluP
MRGKGISMRHNSTPVVTVFLIVINVLVFLYMEITGDTESTEYLYQHGGMYWPDVFENGQWYRLFTHMFIHSGYEHVLYNMFMLGVLGSQMEKEYGSIKYMITYLVSGLGGAVLSALVEMHNNQAVVGVGASGAIFGIFGVYLAMIFKNRHNTDKKIGIRLLVLFAIMVFGNMEEGVDWMAHLGGALVGAFLGLVLYRPEKLQYYE